MKSTTNLIKAPSSLKERLARGAALLDRISRTREESHAQFGENTERLLVSEHLRELEAEIAKDPGALASFFEGAQHG
jgi:hypothetical protein